MRHAKKQEFYRLVGWKGQATNSAPPSRFKVRAIGLVAGTLAALCFVFFVRYLALFDSSSCHRKLFTKAAVASEVPECSELAATVLRQNGTAIDAAVVATLCVGSINSFSSGIGGGGFMVIQKPNGEAEAIDFREVAPSALDPATLNSTSSKIGGLAVGVPGELRGLEAAHSKYGRIPWYQLMMPVAKLNRAGFKVTRTLAERLESSHEWILRDPVWAAVYAAPGGHRVAREGETVIRAAYAQTLEQIAIGGASAFYSGPMAAQIVATVRASPSGSSSNGGGVLDAADLDSYRATVSQALVYRYRGRRVATTHVPSGGPVLQMMMQALEAFGANPESVAHETYVHRAVELMRHGFAHRAELGDPRFVDIGERLRRMRSLAEARRVRTAVSDTRTRDPELYGARFANTKGSGTMHVSVVDEHGYAVALTSTINLVFGAHLMDAATGVILNNQMDDFSLPGTNNAFSLPPSPANYPAAGKRPQSSMAPTIVTDADGAIELVVGASGGSRILSSVFLTMARLFERGYTITDAVHEPRVHDQLSPNQVEFEQDIDVAVQRALRERGHRLVSLPLKGSDHRGTVQAISRIPDGRLEAVADARKAGGVAGI